MRNSGSNCTDTAGPPLWLLAELTYRCPLQCPYCSNPLDFARQGGELSTAEWIDVFRQARELGAAQLGFSGGEPLLRQDLAELIGAARGLGFYTNLLTELQIIGDQKIAAPLAASPAEAKPKLAEQWRSGRSLRNITFNLEAIRRAMFGAGAFETLLADAQFADLKARLSAAFDQAIAAAKDVPEPLDRTIADPMARKKVELLFVRLNQLRDIAKQEVPTALGITLGFNELDGDGS